MFSACWRFSTQSDHHAETAIRRGLTSPAYPDVTVLEPFNRLTELLGRARTRDLRVTKGGADRAAGLAS